MKKFTILTFIICLLALMPCAYAANIVNEDDFADNMPSTAPINREYMNYEGRIYEENGLKYLGPNNNDPARVIMKKIPNDCIVVMMDIKSSGNVDSEQFQISFSKNETGWNWYGKSLYAQYYNCFVSDKEWHKSVTVFDCNANTVDVYVDGKLAGHKTYTTSDEANWNTEGISLVISCPELAVTNIKTAYSDIDGLFGIGTAEFNGHVFRKNGNDYGVLPSMLEKVSVSLEYPSGESELWTVKEDGEEIPCNYVYNEETGKYDITIDGNYKSGKSYEIAISENALTKDSSAYRADSFKFSIADKNYGCTDISITNDGTLKAETDFSNNTFLTQEATLILFVYNADGMMVDCASSETAEIGAAETKTLSAAINSDYSDGYTVQAVIWDNAYNALPLINLK